MNVRYQVLLLEIARHAGSYLELGAAAAGDYRRHLGRRIVMLVAGVITSIAAVVAVWAAGLVALWDTEWRMTYVVVTALVLVAAAFLSLYQAVAPGSAGHSARLLRAELAKDKELFQQWKATL